MATVAAAMLMGARKIDNRGECGAGEERYGRPERRVPWICQVFAVDAHFKPEVCFEKSILGSDLTGCSED